MARPQISTCGCFMIFNKTTRKVYICTSKHTRRLYSQIKYMLKNNRFKNMALTKDWEKYGEDDFAYQLLEECTPEDFYAVKKKWIEYYKADQPEKGYNSSENTYNI